MFVRQVADQVVVHRGTKRLQGGTGAGTTTKVSQIAVTMHCSNLQQQKPQCGGQAQDTTLDAQRQVELLVEEIVDGPAPPPPPAPANAWQDRALCKARPLASYL